MPVFACLCRRGIDSGQNRNFFSALGKYKGERERKNEEFQVMNVCNGYTNVTFVFILRNSVIETMCP